MRSADENQIRIMELTKSVEYSGNLLLDGEFDPPPPPPALKSDFGANRNSFLL